MSDLTSTQWRDIERASIYLPADGRRNVGRYIGIGTLRSILRKHRRTNTQNALLWSLYADILESGGEEMRGWTKDDLHEFFLIDHFGAETLELFGRKRLKPHRRSSRLTKTEFSDFVEHIVRFMAERGVSLTL